MNGTARCPRDSPMGRWIVLETYESWPLSFCPGRRRGKCRVDHAVYSGRCRQSDACVERISAPGVPPIALAAQGVAPV